MTTKDKEEPSAVVPEASPESNAKQEGKKAPASRRKLYVVLAGMALLVAVLCVALPLALKKGDSSASTNTSSHSNSNSAESANKPNTGLPAEDTSRKPEDTNNTNQGVSVSGSVSALLLKSLPLFGTDIIKGYENQADLEGALKIALRKEAQRIIDQNIRNRQQWPVQPPMMYMEGDMAAMEDGGSTSAQMQQPVPEQAESSNMMAQDRPAAGGAAGNEKEVTDFGTNNQEENIDEADIIKADANFIYAAYGDYIIIWNTTGTQLAQVQMPPIQLPESWGKPQDTEVERTQKSMVAPDYSYIPKPSIQSMLLTDNHLIVMVYGYNEDYSWMAPNPMPAPRRMLYGYRACQIRVYQKTATGNLTFVASKDVNGNYVDARSIGDTVHVATAATVDTWTALGQPLDWYYISNNTEISTEEYQSRATRIADSIVPAVAEQLLEELKLENGQFPTMLQINQWFTHVNDTTNAGAGFDLPYYQEYNVISNVAQVTSFNVNDAVAADETLTTSATAYLSPSYFSTLYGTNERLVLATSGWDWNPFLKEGEQTTYLVALQIDGASTTFLSVGSIKGNLLNQYALDIVDDELRAATTVERFPMWWWGPRPIDDVMPMMAETTTTVAESAPVSAAEGNTRGRRSLQEAAVQDAMPPQTQTPSTEESRTENYMVVLKLAGDDVPAGQMLEKGRVQIGEHNERITSVRFFDNVAYAVTFERTDPFYVLDMSVPKVLGELKLPGFSSYLHSMNENNTQLLAVGQNATDDGMVTGLMVTVFDATTPSAPKALVSHTFEQNDQASGYSGSSVEWDYKAFRYVAGKLIVPLEVIYNQEWDYATQTWLPLPEGVENFVGFVVLNVDTTAITEQYRVNHRKSEATCTYCGGYLPQRSFVYNGELMTIRDNYVIGTDFETGERKWNFTVQVEGEPAECCF